MVQYLPKIKGKNHAETRIIRAGNNKSLDRELGRSDDIVARPESWTAPYTFLGLADFLSVTGSKPMNITWRLHEPIPAKFLRETNKLVVG